jgi:transcriptional regulator with XRE-family HTH domain
VIDLRTRGERLQWVREQLGLSRAEAKQRLGISTSTYSSYEAAEQGASNSRNFSYEKAEEIARKLGAPSAAHWMYTGKGARPKVNSDDARAEPSPDTSKPQPRATAPVPRATVPVVGFFGAPTGEGSLYGFDTEEIARPCFATDATVAIEIKGKSLAEGMFAFFNREASALGPSHIGHLCVLGMDHNRILLRRIADDGKKQTMILPYNDVDAKIDKRKVKWAASVIAIAPR